MTELTDYQFELLQSENDASGFVFGPGADVEVDQAGFSPAQGDWITQDQQDGRTGITAFGRDVLGAGTWTFASFTNKDDVGPARDAVGACAAAWRGAKRLAAGEVQVLRYALDGVARRTYGRARRFAAPPTNLILNGYVPITHDFSCVDANVYDDVEKSVIVHLESGGQTTLEFPLTFPIAASAPGISTQAQAAVGGTEQAYPIITFQGPWVNPGLDTAGWSLRFNTSLSASQSLTVDTRPWVMTMLRNDGVSLAGALKRGTYLEDIVFEPGQRTTITASGSATGGSTQAVIRWRDAYSSY